ncbi:hypothetical protein GCM10010964_43330 [Caldovatus sediminis]|uniref:Uncharacterized protein n=1 Tax=Caldovatus sediminis TaxID=2041189 RepID=A0A8J2ZFU7_9PROT|nr:hypothetical protein [Caldovatus sediminis]GGG51419.1 hypothetical protein GCM10010964_43330 [Caldovatus sediminis]
MHIHRRRLAFRVVPPHAQPPRNGTRRLSDVVAVVLGAALAFWIGWTAMHACGATLADLPLIEAWR